MPRDRASRCHRVVAASFAAALTALLGEGSGARAEPPGSVRRAPPPGVVVPRVAPPSSSTVTAIEPGRVQGIERAAVEEGEAQRRLLSGLLFVPREMVRLMFLAGGVTAGLIRDEQVVPRAAELLSPGPGQVSLLPWLFVDTRRRTSVGAQMIASGRESGTRLSFGFGGVHDWGGEGRVRLGFGWPIPFVISMEGLADQRSTLDYLGVGQEPDKDARNRFRTGALTRQATYYEQRSRVIGSLGARVAPDWEIFLSGSFTRSFVQDTPEGGAATISRVFAPGSVPGAPGMSAACIKKGAISCGAESHVAYGELALRLDTRPTKARPSAGVLVETYAGVGHAWGDDDTARFYRVGGRAALFVSIVRPTNILSPKLVLDGMVVPGDRTPPFTALVSQPDFRGFDNRFDRVSLVASLDYRFSIVRFLGARLFMDLASVGPDVGAMLDAPKRLAGGFGFDVFSSSTELASMVLAFSSEGAVATFTFGVPTFFGDRQHRR
ncbi:Hypothetical protein A7982_01714 [Minicystis rosea]|nr:Hypothetical protein A7982_01714 [Minicystis rosea]